MRILLIEDEKALAAAKDGDTVGIIVRNLNLTQELTFPADISVTLKLHGNSLTLNSAAYPLDAIPDNIKVVK